MVVKSTLILRIELIPPTLYHVKYWDIPMIYLCMARALSHNKIIY